MTTSVELSALLLLLTCGHKLLTSVGVKLGVVQVLDNLLDGLDGAVPVVRSALLLFGESSSSSAANIHLEVASDEELTCHFECWCVCIV